MLCKHAQKYQCENREGIRVKALDALDAVVLHCRHHLWVDNGGNAKPREVKKKAFGGGGKEQYT